MDSWPLAKSAARGALGLQSPVYVQFAVTHRCNLHCRMCNSNASREGERELSLVEIDTLARILARLNPGVLVLTGGEPLARKDFLEVYATFVRHGLRPRLQTNGLLADETTLRALVKLGLSEVTLSLDSLDESTQDEINGARGSFRATLEALARFSQLLPSRGNLSGVNIVVSRRNVDEVLRVVSFVDEAGFHASIIPVHTAAPGDSAFIIRKQADDFRFVPDDPRVHRVFAALLAMKRRGVKIQNSSRFLRACPDYLCHGKVSWRCDSPRLFFSISPSGHFLPCVDLPGERSMLEASFLKDYLNGTIAQSLRQRVSSCSGCLYACWPEVTFLVTDPGTALERAVQAVRLARTTRVARTEAEMLSLARACSSRDPWEARLCM